MSFRRKTTTATPSEADRKPLWQRLAWLVGIWVASVAILGIVAYLLRLFMNAAGMTS